MWVDWYHRYHEGGRLSDEQMALLQYQRENLHFLSEEVCDDLKFTIGSASFFAFHIQLYLLHKEFQFLIHMLPTCIRKHNIFGFACLLRCMIIISKHLAMQILRLQECLSKYERSNDGSTPQVIIALANIIYLFFYK